MTEVKLIEWRMLQSPWGPELAPGIALDIQQRPFVLVESVVETLRAGALGLDLPRVGALLFFEGRSWKRFELVSTGPESDGVEDLVLDMVPQRQRITISLMNGVRSVVPVADANNLSEPAGSQVSSFLGRHVELIYGELDDKPSLGGRCATSLTSFLDGWKRSEDTREPKLTLIVRLAAAIGSTIYRIGWRPRRILRRRRQMERVAAARQIDASCIRWLARQPGRTLAERAGPRQRIRAVVREESLDTLENRVLVDLQKRSLEEALRWLRDHSDKEFRQYDRYLAIQGFRQMLIQLRDQGPLTDLQPALGSVEPNYVLQYDERYGKIWPWYLKLRRRHQERDRLWRWGHRTFAESVRLALSWALQLLEEQQEHPLGACWTRSLILQVEQYHGCFVDTKSQLACWLVWHEGELRAVSLLLPDQIAGFEELYGSSTSLSELAVDALVVLHDPFSRTAPIAALGVWTRLRFSNTELPDFEALARVISSARSDVELSGVLVEPGQPDSGVLLEDPHLEAVGKWRAIRLARIHTPLQVDKSRFALQQVVRTFLLREEDSWSHP